MKTRLGTYINFNYLRSHLSLITSKCECIEMSVHFVYNIDYDVARRSDSERIITSMNYGVVDRKNANFHINILKNNIKI